MIHPGDEQKKPTTNQFSKEQQADFNKIYKQLGQFLVGCRRTGHYPGYVAKKPGTSPGRQRTWWRSAIRWFQKNDGVLLGDVTLSPTENEAEFQQAMRNCYGNEEALNECLAASNAQLAEANKILHWFKSLVQKHSEHNSFTAEQADKEEFKKFKDWFTSLAEEDIESEGVDVRLANQQECKKGDEWFESQKTANDWRAVRQWYEYVVNLKTIASKLQKKTLPFKKAFTTNQARWKNPQQLDINNPSNPEYWVAQAWNGRSTDRIKNVLQRLVGKQGGELDQGQMAKMSKAMSVVPPSEKTVLNEHAESFVAAVHLLVRCLVRLNSQTKNKVRLRDDATELHFGTTRTVPELMTLTRFRQWHTGIGLLKSCLSILKQKTFSDLIGTSVVSQQQYSSLMMEPSYPVLLNTTAEALGLEVATSTQEAQPAVWVAGPEKECEEKAKVSSKRLVSRGRVVISHECQKKGKLQENTPPDTQKLGSKQKSPSPSLWSCWCG